MHDVRTLVSVLFTVPFLAIPNIFNSLQFHRMIFNMPEFLFLSGNYQFRIYHSACKLIIFFFFCRIIFLQLLIMNFTSHLVGFINFSATESLFLLPVQIWSASTPGHVKLIVNKPTFYFSAFCNGIFKYTVNIKLKEHSCRKGLIYFSS